jgi:hypothetical protein
MHNFKIELTGKDFTNWMGKLLSELGHKFSTTAETDIVKDIKESCVMSHLILKQNFKNHQAVQRLTKNMNFQI